MVVASDYRHLGTCPPIFFASLFFSRLALRFDKFFFFLPFPAIGYPCSPAAIIPTPTNTLANADARITAVESASFMATKTISPKKPTTGQNIKTNPMVSQTFLLFIHRDNSTTLEVCQEAV